VRVFSNDTYREGIHYQCVFYGGRLLSHLSADDPDVNEDEALKILRVNRNAIMLMDSDRRKLCQPLNPTKKRIIDEIKCIEGMSWVTKGKEIENYIPADTIAAYYKRNSLKQVDQFDDFYEYLNKIISGEGRKYAGRKPLFADRLCPYITMENSQGVLDLQHQVSKVIRHIQQWNK
jgi:hypothetical protein